MKCCMNVNDGKVNDRHIASRILILITAAFRYKLGCL